VARDGRDLGAGAPGQGQPRDGGPAQVVEVQVFVAEPGTLERFVPRCSETVAGPQLAKGVSQYSKLDKADRRFPPKTDEEIDREADQQYELIDKILSHSPITREGLALQCRAMIMDGWGVWNDDGRTARFLGNMVLFF
jgi:hypothetical protein